MIYFLGTFIKKLSLFIISMASALGFSFIDDELENKIENKVKKRCRTLRKKSKNKKSSSKINNLLNSLSVYQNKQNNNDDEDELENFVPLEEKTEQFENKSNIEMFSETENSIPEVIENTNPSPVEGFSQLNSVSAQDYYKQYIPYYNKINNDSSVTNQDDLMKKLNYMITLLEEQQDEKTENVTEELVLYLFLGVFVIFVVDSFARAGKYTR